MFVAMASALLAPIALSSPAVAAPEKEKDPNRMVCQKQEILGSRLGTKRVCKTAAEWKAERDNNRQYIDRAQSQRVTTGG